MLVNLCDTPFIRQCGTTAISYTQSRDTLATASFLSQQGTHVQVLLNPTRSSLTLVSISEGTTWLIKVVVYNGLYSDTTYHGLEIFSSTHAARRSLACLQLPLSQPISLSSQARTLKRGRREAHKRERESLGEWSGIPLENFYNSLLGWFGQWGLYHFYRYHWLQRIVMICTSVTISRVRIPLALSIRAWKISCLPSKSLRV